MSRVTTLVASVLLAAVLPVAASTPASDPPAAVARLDGDRPGWRRVRLEASKLFVSMRVDFGVARQAASALDVPLLTTTEAQPVPAGETVTRLDYVTDALGRHSEVTLLLDGDTGAALQRHAIDTGKRQRMRDYRFADTGAMRWTSRPRSGEESLGPDAWTDRSAELRAYPAEMPDAPLTEATALVYLVAASALDAPGDRLEMLAYSSSSDVVHRVTAVVAERDKVRVDFRESGAGRSIRHEDKRVALRVKIDGQPLPGQDDDEFELLGMRDIELLLDPDTRAPLELSGRVPVFGRVSFTLQELVPREDSAAAG